MRGKPDQALARFLRSKASFHCSNDGFTPSGEKFAGGDRGFVRCEETFLCSEDSFLETLESFIGDEESFPCRKESFIRALKTLKNVKFALLRGRNANPARIPAILQGRIWH